MSNAGASGYGLKIDNAGTGVALVISGKTSGTVSVSAPSVAGTTTFNLPGNNGVLGQALVTDGSGNTSWSATSQRTVRSISALRTLDATDSVILASGTFTVTLPTAVSITGRIYTIKNSSSGTITVATTSSQTIYTTAGGVSTLTLSQGVSYDVISDGSNWQTI